jgi:hypothetical protein
MERKQTDMLQALKTLRVELMEQTAFQNTADRIALMQAFDRLYMGYQNGSISQQDAESGVSEIRHALQSTSPTRKGLMPHISSRRNDVLNRNYRDLAERMLSAERGSWDFRHLEIVQGAISHLAQSGNAMSDLAQGLQQRMSDSVWLGNLELAETVAEVAAQTRELEQSLLDALEKRSASFDPQTQDVISSDMHLVNETQKAVEQAVNQSSLSMMKAKLASQADDLKVSKAYVENLAQKVAKQQQDKAQGEAVKQASSSIQKAGVKLVEDESRRLSNLFKSAIHAVRTSLTPEEASKLAQIAAIDTQGESESAHALAERAAQVAAALRQVNAQSPQLQKTAREIDKMQWRLSMLNEIITHHPTPSAPESTDAAQLLDARMMYEHKRMQFELQQNYRTDGSDMFKALDYEVKTPVFENTASSSAVSHFHHAIQRVRQIAQSAAAGDVGFYAPEAGSEHNRNAQSALHIADMSAPNVSAMPTLQSELAKRSNKLLHDVKQLAFMPSVRADMGFVAPRYQMDAASNAPLFKRVRFNKDNKQANEVLPALYRVAGLKLKGEGSTPLRKKFGDLDLRAANLELVKIIENQFDSGLSGRVSDKVQGLANESGQIKPKSDDPHARVANIISDWVESRHDLKNMKSDTSSLIKTGRMGAGAIENTLKGEGMRLPASVQEKLSPFLGFDLSNIKIFSGPVAAMASEAMGAHAFTLGQNIFLGKNKLDFNTPEGLGLLAHELLHTSHFNAGDSVEAKEQAAEAMEDRVKQAFGSGSSMSFALESSKDKKSSGQTDMSSSATGTVPAGTVGTRPAYDTEYIFETVCEKVFEMMMDDFRKVQERESK